MEVSPKSCLFRLERGPMKYTCETNGEASGNPSPSNFRCWHMNFADKNLFFGYGTDLFAQDEIQVCEHPDLAHIREYLLHLQGMDLRGLKLIPSCMDSQQPSPCLFTSVPRRLAVEALSEIYGNKFAHASEDTLKESVSIVSPCSFTNVLAIAAPKGGVGRYTESQIWGIVQTLVAGYSSVVQVSLSQSNGCPDPVHLHGGLWGCGAFGGCPDLMITLQMVVASACGLSELVFHVMDSKGEAAFGRAQSTFNEFCLLYCDTNTNTQSQTCVQMSRFVDYIASRGYHWGESNRT